MISILVYGLILMSREHMIEKEQPVEVRNRNNQKLDINVFRKGKNSMIV